MGKVGIMVKGEEQDINHKYGNYYLNQSTVKNTTQIYASLFLTLLGSRCMILFGELNSYHTLLITSQQARHIISKGKVINQAVGKI